MSIFYIISGVTAHEIQCQIYKFISKFYRSAVHALKEITV